MSIVNFLLILMVTSYTEVLKGFKKEFEIIFTTLRIV